MAVTVLQNQINEIILVAFCITMEWNPDKRAAMELISEKKLCHPTHSERWMAIRKLVPSGASWIAGNLQEYAALAR